jgi:pimeloyl-ACP methyl ester carboxylesterase/predicted glycosyltransferase
MRAREPDHQGIAQFNGTRIAYEVFGHGQPALLLVPGWPWAYSRLWKAQTAFLSRYYRVIAFDMPGNGRSDRPTDRAAYRIDALIGYATAVLDATQTTQAILVGASAGAMVGLALAATTPQRVSGMIFIGAGIPVSEPLPTYMARWREPIASSEGWDKVNRRHMSEQFSDAAQFFFEHCFIEPHSTKPIEDGMGWALETSGAPLVAFLDGLGTGAAIDRVRPLIEGMASQVHCPVLLIHGSRDEITQCAWSEWLAERFNWDFIRYEGSGHLPMIRDPIRFNSDVRAFVDRVHPPAPQRKVWKRANSRQKRALFVSSPIGLGHAQRDIAIAQELQRLQPDLAIEWLAQPPVTLMLEEHNLRIHPASRLLASESKHIECESSEHDLHCFQALRRMDEILVANFHVFDDVAKAGNYDLWVCDEAWDVDFFLHDNPELKRAAYCWLTDFVGFVPMPEGGDAEAALTADYNAEMIEQIERYKRVRDRSIFVGNPEDIVPLRFGDGMPWIREWTQKHFDFSGYVTGFTPVTDRDALRHTLGYRSDEQVCVVAVGGSGIGDALLRKVIRSFPACQAKLPALRMIVVAGPRIDPTSLPQHPGLEIRGYVPELYKHLSICDLAVVQGGLTTAMELTANQRPFLYFPLAEHFEQQFHVPHRLSRYGAGRRMDYANETPESIAAAIVEHMGAAMRYRTVETDGAQRAAGFIAEML